MFFVELQRLLVNNEYSESVVIAIDKESLRNFESNELRNISHLLVINHYFLMLYKVVLIFEETNIDSLFTINLITVLSEILDEFKRSNLSVILSKLVRNLIRAFGSKPWVSPIFKNKFPIRVTFIVAILKSGNEIFQGGISPSMSFEVNLKTIAESFPAH